MHSSKVSSSCNAETFQNKTDRRIKKRPQQVCNRSHSYYIRLLLIKTYTLGKELKESSSNVLNSDLVNVWYTKAYAMSCTIASVICNTLLKYSSVVCQAPADFLCSKMSSGCGMIKGLLVDSLSQLGSVVDGPVKTRLDTYLALHGRNVQDEFDLNTVCILQ